MKRSVGGVLILRVHQNMAYAVSTQNIPITVFNFDQDPIVISPDHAIQDLKALPRLFRNRTSLDGFRDVVSLVKTIRSIRPEVIHVNALQDLIPTFIAVRICNMLGDHPVIIAMSRNSLTWENPRRARLYARIIKFFSDGFIALATTHKEYLLSLGVPSEKVAVIPNPYDPDYIRQNQSYDPEKPVKITRLVYVANICKNKAQDVLIKAASIVLKEFPGVQVELVGKVLSGEEEFADGLESLIQREGLQQSVHFTGEVPYDEVFNLVQKCDVFVYPTQAEMMPRAVIEAMVIGKPVIASSVDGILDLIQSRKTGFLVQSGNVEELAEAISELINNPGLAYDVGLAGQKFVLDFCSPEKVGKQICDFYASRQAVRKLWVAQT